MDAYKEFRRLTNHSFIYLTSTRKTAINKYKLSKDYVEERNSLVQYLLENFNKCYLVLKPYEAVRVYSKDCKYKCTIERSKGEIVEKIEDWRVGTVTKMPNKKHKKATDVRQELNDAYEEFFSLDKSHVLMSKIYIARVRERHYKINEIKKLIGLTEFANEKYPDKYLFFSRSGSYIYESDGTYVSTVRFLGGKVVEEVDDFYKFSRYDEIKKYISRIGEEPWQ